MNYTVLWTPAAEQELAAVWTASQDRKAVTQASAAIDRLLADDPENVGVARFDSVRSLSVLPLGVDYEIVEADRTVWVLTVWDVTQAASSN